MTFMRWARGHLPAYRPTLADQWALANGLASETPVVIHNHPVAMRVLKVKR